MEEEQLNLLKELNDNIKALKSENKSMWHKHPLVISVFTLFISGLLMSISGWATLPLDNKKAIEANERLIVAIDNIPNNNAANLLKIDAKLMHHINNYERDRDRLDDRINIINNNFRAFHNAILDKPDISTVLPINE